MDAWVSNHLSHGGTGQPDTHNPACKAFACCQSYRSAYQEVFPLFYDLDDHSTRLEFGLVRHNEVEHNLVEKWSLLGILQVWEMYSTEASFCNVLMSLFHFQIGKGQSLRFLPTSTKP